MATEVSKEAFLAALRFLGRPQPADAQLWFLTHILDVPAKCVAEDLGLTKAQVSRYMNGVASVPAGRRRQIAGLMRRAIAAYDRAISQSEEYYTDPVNAAGLEVLRVIVAQAKAVLAAEESDRRGEE